MVKPHKIRHAQTHPPLCLPGTNGILFGGRAKAPAEGYYDLMIDLDGGAPYDSLQCETLITAPWPNRQPPPDMLQAVDLANQVVHLLKNHGRVHIGCGVGHGRTGVLMCMVAHELKIGDPVTWLRINYCAEVVETYEQMAWLRHHFNIPWYPPSMAMANQTLGS